MAVIGELKPFFGEIARLLRTLVNNTCGTPTISTSGGSAVDNPETIPAGFRSVAIVKTSSNSDTVVITLIDGTTYTMTELGETFIDASGSLPSYVISGAGTWKWHGLK